MNSMRKYTVFGNMDAIVIFCLTNCQFANNLKMISNLKKIAILLVN